MKMLYYHLHLLEPALVTALEGDPNSAVSFDYIPGSVIRGAIIGLFSRKNQVDAADETTRWKFFSENTQYLNAYPVVNGARSLPVPKSWSVEKGQKTPITDSAWTSETLKKGIGGFAVVTDEQQVMKAHIHRFIAAHTQRDREKGRSVEGSGAIYRYDSLAAGQVFAGMILCEDDADADWLGEYIKDGAEIHIGGARSAGYGRVVFNNVQAGNWGEVETHFENGQPLIVTLLSDTILRNDNGEYESNLAVLQNTLAHHLNIAPSAFKTHGKSYIETTFIGGFNRKWGLPLPQTAALKMGSTVVFTDHNLNREQVNTLMRWGIGERRAEGFGRLGVNIYTEGQYKLAEADKEKTSDDMQVITLYKQLSPELAQRKLRQLLDEQIVEKANAITVRNPPRSSQINALRQAVQNDPANLPNTLDHINKRAATRRQFDKARINGMKLTDWVLQTSTAQDTWDDPIINALLERSGNAAQERTRYNLRLIDMVLAQAAKQAQKRGND